MAHKWWHPAPKVSSKNSPGYPGPKIDPSKSGWQKIKDDVQMDLGVKTKDADYYARLDGRAAATKAMMDEMSAREWTGNRSSILTKKKEGPETVADTDTDGTDGVKKLDQDLDLENVDNTPESIAATAKANEAHTEVVDQSGATFGTGSDVTSVVQKDESFIDADLKKAQQLASDNATLAQHGVSVDDLSGLGFSSTEQFLSETKRLNAIAEESNKAAAAEEAAKLSANAALTFNDKVYDNRDEMIEAIRADAIATDKAAAAGGASSILNLAGSNTTTGNSGDALNQVTVAEQNLNSSTAKGGSMEKAAAISTGPAEDKAIENYEKGRRSTILTTPEGLLNDDELEEDGTFRKKRGLIV